MSARADGDRTGVLLTFARRRVRDIAWSILVPPIAVVRSGGAWNPDDVAYDEYGRRLPILWSNPEIWDDGSDRWDAFSRCEHALRDLDRGGGAFDALEERLAAYDGARRGIYFERLCEEWFRLDPRYEVVAADIQISDSVKTIGQIDFVLSRSGSAPEAREVAIKYFLQTGSPGALSRWRGTNLRERMDEKFARCAAHQIPLPLSREAREYLSPSARPVRSTASIRGALFYDLRKSVERGLAENDRIVGWWGPGQIVEKVYSGSVEAWATAESRHWFAPATDDEFSPERIVPSGQLDGMVRHRSATVPTLVVGLRSGREITRGFVFEGRF